MSSNGETTQHPEVLVLAGWQTIHGLLSSARFAIRRLHPDWEGKQVNDEALRQVSNLASDFGMGVVLPEEVKRFDLETFTAKAIAARRTKRLAASPGGAQGLPDLGAAVNTRARSTKHRYFVYGGLRQALRGMEVGEVRILVLESEEALLCAQKNLTSITKELGWDKTAGKPFLSRASEYRAFDMVNEVKLLSIKRLA